MEIQKSNWVGILLKNLILSLALAFFSVFIGGLVSIPFNVESILAAFVIAFLILNLVSCLYYILHTNKVKPTVILIVAIIFMAAVLFYRLNNRF